MVKSGKILRKPNKLYGFDILRVVAFLIVFSSHTMWTKCNATWGGWGVSAFLMMSGYLMMHNYYCADRIQIFSKKMAFIWVLKSIKSLWILHVLLTFVSIQFTYVTIENIKQFGIELLLDILMIKEWLPFRSSGMLNGGVSWYLCSVLASYMFFPLFLRYVENKYTHRKCLIISVALVILQVIIGVIGSSCPTVIRADDSWWENNWCHWLVYRFPFSRMIDFLLGSNMAYFNIVSLENGIREKKLRLMCAGFLCAVSIVITYIYRNSFNVEGTSQCWWSYTLINTIPLCMLTMTIGQIKYEKESFFIKKISALTTSAFLIHYVVIKYINQFLDLRGYYNYRELILLTYGLMISLVFAYLYDSLLVKK